MKRKNLIIGTVSLAAITAVFMFVPFNFNKQGAYKQTDLSVFQKQTADDAQKWLEARYIDLETGKKITPEKLSLIIQEQQSMERSVNSFQELGPDNIGGRTRAILIDRNDPLMVWAGGITGGLFYSTDGANYWFRDDAFPGLPYISTMAQTLDGTIFVGTGSGLGSDSWPGNGLYYKTKAANSVWTLVPGTGSLSYISEVVASGVDNTIFFGTATGLKKWTVNDAAIAAVQVASANGSCDQIKISPDGQVIVVSMSGSKTHISNDGGASFKDVSGAITAKKVPAGAPLIEYAISDSKNSTNAYTVYAVRTGGNLLGMHVSSDNGNTWDQFVGASGTPSSLDIYRDQGTYNSTLIVDPRNSERLLIGGIDIWQWEQKVNNPPAGGFEQLSQWFLSPTEDLYVHADNHEMKFSTDGSLYLGNDGGIQITKDYGATYFPANRGYNVTQFYGIAMDREGAVMGGTQDNGSLYNDFSNASYKEFTEIGGGDGFECEISFFNPNVIFSSVYANAVRRSGDKGQSSTDFDPPYPATYGTVGATSGGGNFPFHTEFVLAEYYDKNSTDKVLYLPKKDYLAGQTLRVPSLSSGDTIDYKTPTNLYYDDTVFANSSLTIATFKVVNGLTGNTVDLGSSSYTFTFDNAPAGVSVGDTLLLNSTTIAVTAVTPYNHYFGQNSATNEIFDMGEEDIVYNISWDTISVTDPYQSWYMIYTTANGGELWATRDALRLSTDAKWVNFATGLGGSGYSSIDIEFSKDLNYCYISCGSGVYRVDGLGSLYSQSPTFENDVLNAGAAKRKISNQSCEGIALNPSNANDLILLQGFSGNILRSDNNATVASPTFSPLTNLGLGAYDAIIDRKDPKIIVVGTALGVRVTSNGGTSWQNASAGFENVPVYEVRQNWRTWAEGCKREGEIYLGTFGRGIWVSSDLLGFDNKGSKLYKETKTDLKLYPNPARDISTLSFNMIKNENVAIRVYNLAGALVKTIDLKQVEKGYQTVDLDVSGLTNGTYIVKFKTNSYEETVKFVKM